MRRSLLFGMLAPGILAVTSGDGLRRPQNAPGVQQTPIGVQPGSPAITVAHIIIVSGPGGGVFIYSGTPGAGNPPVAWISNGTTDPYGNALPNGAELGIAGTGVFTAGNTLITPSGEFIYSGTPALGNLVISLTPAAGTDSLGNVYKADFTVYGSNGTSVQVLAGTPASVRIGTGDAAETTPGLISTVIQGSGPTRSLGMILQSPIISGAPSAFAQLQMLSPSADLTTLPVALELTVSDGVNVAGLQVIPTNWNFTQSITATGGTPANPTLITTDSWNSLGALGAGSGYTVTRGRYQLTNDGRTEVDISLTAGAATVAGVYLFANTMPASPNYRPINNRSYPMGWNGSVTAGMNFPSLRVGSNGTVNLQLPALPNGTVVSCTQRIPVN
jgi:hypothetical protein